MAPESWLVLTVAAAFLLLGVAGSPLAWAVLLHRRSRSEELMELRWRKLDDKVRALENRWTQHESAKPTDPAPRSFMRGGSHAGRGAIRVDAATQRTLIAVPNLEAAPSDRDLSLGGLKERYAAIWALADSGSTPEVIARATSQPIGQIELILGLRRQIDDTRSIVSHAPHV